MDMLIGYGTIVAFLILVIVVLELTHKKSNNFTDYAVAGRSFGSWFQTMAFLNTWLPGTIFISFAGMAAASGVIGFYVVFYSLLAILFMFFMAEKVHRWGARFDLRTQADFVGMRYRSTPVRVVSAIIGVVSVFPWVVLGFQSMGLVFSYLSFGAVSPLAAVFVGIGVIAIRQIWTIRMGMRGIVISDMVQGIIAYGFGAAIATGFIVWLLAQGMGLDALPAEFATLPGLGSELGPLYFFSIVLTGGLGAWCWPDIFVRLFTAKSAATVKKSAIKAAPILFIFGTALLLMSMLAHSLPAVAEAPDNVWFLTTAIGGPFVLALAGTCVLAAAIGNINALNASIGTHAAQDIIHVRGDASDATVTRTAKITVGVTTVLAVIGAIFTVDTTTGLITLALASYQGVVQLAPSLFLGIFWRRGTAAGALVGMIVGFVVAATLQVIFPVSIGALAGLTSGMVGLIINTVIYLAFAFLRPADAAERARVDHLFDEVATRAEPTPVVAVEIAK
jgi:solute:Na+ symporter, SSS family